jgi:RNA polymerase sigma-70 factor, ECF subfamily
VKTKTLIVNHRNSSLSFESASEWAQCVYPELRRIAGSLFHSERTNHTLQPTAVVHEALIRLFERGPEKYTSRAHFFGVISRAMRQILVEHARGRSAKKRGGDWERVPMEEADLVAIEGPDLVALDAALHHLNVVDSKLCRIVELRVFGALTFGELAVLLKRGESTVRRDWAIAKAWLQRDLKNSYQ